MTESEEEVKIVPRGSRARGAARSAGRWMAFGGLVILVACGLYGAGYLHRAFTIRPKVDALEAQVAAYDQRERLFEARLHVERAQAAIEAENFGIARREVESAAGRVEGAHPELARLLRTIAIEANQGASALGAAIERIDDALGADRSESAPADPGSG